MKMSMAVTQVRARANVNRTLGTVTRKFSAQFVLADTMFSTVKVVEELLQIRSTCTTRMCETSSPRTSASTTDGTETTSTAMITEAIRDATITNVKSTKSTHVNGTDPTTTGTESFDFSLMSCYSSLRIFKQALVIRLCSKIAPKRLDGGKKAWIIMN
jgi:hypothetical protein